MTAVQIIQLALTTVTITFSLLTIRFTWQTRRHLRAARVYRHATDTMRATGIPITVTPSDYRVKWPWWPRWRRIHGYFDVSRPGLWTRGPCNYISTMRIIDDIAAGAL